MIEQMIKEVQQRRAEVDAKYEEEMLRRRQNRIGEARRAVRDIFGDIAQELRFGEWTSGDSEWATTGCSFLGVLARAFWRGSALTILIQDDRATIAKGIFAKGMSKESMAKEFCSLHKGVKKLEKLTVRAVRKALLEAWEERFEECETLAGLANLARQALGSLADEESTLSEWVIQAQERIEEADQKVEAAAFILNRQQEFFHPWECFRLKVPVYPTDDPALTTYYVTAARPTYIAISGGQSWWDVLNYEVKQGQPCAPRRTVFSHVHSVERLWIDDPNDPMNVTVSEKFGGKDVYYRVPPLGVSRVKTEA